MQMHKNKVGADRIAELQCKEPPTTLTDQEMIRLYPMINGKTRGATASAWHRGPGR